MKAVKNSTELENIRACYLRDSAALCRFIYWLKKQAVLTEETEYTAAMKLDGLRAQIEDFRGLSFPTISAYGPNAAMMHYQAGPEDAAGLRPEGMLLVDSGGQYLSGTTDVTRTMSLGPVTEEMRLHYTLTAVGNLQLMDAVFLYGCTGRTIDVLSREPLWKIGIDYKCGTGHGIGYYLNVHENPPNIRWRYAPGMHEDVMEPGMIVSDEPGVYLQDRYGIRIETILECVEKETNGDGTFLAFRPLTLVPLDRELLLPDRLTPQTREALDRYHERVYQEVAPLLPPEEAAWLRGQTLPL
jgi:Xaa-Pro aminopeptidase